VVGRLVVKPIPERGTGGGWEETVGRHGLYDARRGGEVEVEAVMVPVRSCESATPEARSDGGLARFGGFVADFSARAGNRERRRGTG